MRRVQTGFGGFIALGMLSACGTAIDEGYAPTLVTLRGAITESSVGTGGSVKAALVWLVDGEHSLLGDGKSVQEVDLKAEFPAKFELDVTELPPVGAMNQYPELNEGDDERPIDAGERPSEPSVEPEEPEDHPSAREQDFGGGGGDDDADLLPFKFAYGTVIIYEDSNGNGALDLIPLGATQPIDTVLGAAEQTVIIYIEGPGQTIDGVTLAPGFNLLGLPNHDEEILTLEIEGMTPEELQNMYEEGAFNADPSVLPIDTVIEIPLTADPKLAREYLCANDRGSAVSVEGSSQLGGCIEQPSGETFCGRETLVSESPADAPPGAIVTCFSDGGFHWRYQPDGLCGHAMEHWFEGSSEEASDVESAESFEPGRLHVDCANWEVPEGDDPCEQLGMALGEACESFDGKGQCGASGRCEI